MNELQFLIAGQFIVSTLMGLAALCLFVWAAAAGILTDVERVKHQVLEVEGTDDERRARARPSGPRPGAARPDRGARARRGPLVSRDRECMAARRLCDPHRVG